MDIAAISSASVRFAPRLEQVKATVVPRDFDWYPYGTLANFYLLDKLLTGGNRDLHALVGGGTAVDIGAADGELAFFMESLGVPMHVVDYPPTNYNGCRGVRALKAALRSQVEILETDIDAQFQLPDVHYGLAFLLGILYHLKNPYLVLERLARQARYAFVSTRVARFNVAAGAVRPPGSTNDSRVSLHTTPVAYLVDADECNNDATNFWMFSDAGLRRILHRTGWDVLDYMTVGNTTDSDPATAAGDERAFCLVRSRHFAP